jgi:signal transduction histidine kinase
MVGQTAYSPAGGRRRFRMRRDIRRGQCQRRRSVPETIIGDSVRVGQIVMNLVANAIKFTSAGKIEILVSLEGEPTREGILLQFSVKDTGIGIPADKLETIFEAFIQADGSTTRRYAGSGLGLNHLATPCGDDGWPDSGRK